MPRPEVARPTARRHRRTPRRTIGRALLVVLVGSGAAFAPASAAAADEPASYVALGDSYAAGPGIPTQYGTPPGCGRSTSNYPAVAAAALAAGTFTDASCSGATTEHLSRPQETQAGTNPPQLDALTADTDLVTLTIGGNDIGFSEIVGQCAARSPAEPGGAACRDHYHSSGSDELAARIEAAAPDVQAGLQAVQERSPDADVLVVGYPTILPDSGPGCFPVVPYSPGDTEYLRETTKRLNDMLAAEAAIAGAEYVDTYTPTIGHDVCTAPGTKWVEGLTPTSPAAPLHPNALGMQAMAAAVVAAAED